jgi:hypothetical protein
MESSSSVKICDTNNPSGSFACFNCNVDVFTKLAHLCQIKKQSDNTIIDFTEFLRTIHQDSICFKVLTNRDIFITEYANIDILKEIFKDKFSDYTTFYEYDGCVGFEITIEGGVFNIDKLYHQSIQTTVVYVLLQHKCNDIATYDGYDIEQLVSDIVPVLQILHSSGYVHNDIKYDNVVYCGDRFKLIDYGEMMNVSHYVLQYQSNPEDIFSRQMIEFDKILQHIQYFRRQKEIEARRAAGNSGGALSNRQKSKKRRYNKKYRRSKKTLKYTKRKPKHYKK